MIYSTWSGWLKWKWWKNAPDLKALLFGWYPEFVYRDVDDLGGHVPVFTFHEVEPESFEIYCRHLAEGGYRTLHPDEYIGIVEGRYRAPDRGVLLTFDDGGGSLWAVAYPLLRKYGLRGTAFVVTGLVPEHDRDRPNLADVWEGRADREDVTGRERSEQRFCTWKELATMQDEGVVSVQSHTHWHALVPVSDRVMDFVNPGTKRYHLGNFNISAAPETLDDLDDPPDRSFALGRPVYESLPRMAGAPAYIPDSRVGALCERFVAQNGGRSFFSNRCWRSKLRELVHRNGTEGTFESPGSYKRSVERELSASRKTIDAQLGTKTDFLCYPWFWGSERAVEASRRVGYRASFWGTGPPVGLEMSAINPYKIPRLDAIYLRRLSGPYQVSLTEVLGRHYGQAMSQSLGFSRLAVESR